MFSKEIEANSNNSFFLKTKSVLMRIKNIKIKNYRGILNEEIEFNEQVNVFIGGNGAGKTTLLEAIIASLLKITFGIIGNHIYKSNLISKNDINYTANNASILLNLKIPIPIDIPALSEDREYDIPLFVKTGVLGETEAEKFYNQKYNRYAVDFKKRVEHGLFDLPIIKYYPANRGAINYTNKTSSAIYLNARIEAWSNIIQNDISYSKFFKWFFDYETKELMRNRDDGHFKYKNPNINYVRQAIQQAFKIINNKIYTVKSEKIKRNGTNQLVPVLALQEQGKKNQEILDHKSSGEKAITTLIADIAYNLSIAHDFRKDDKFLESPGIVLIDEIEAHLHPNWQRKIIPLLTELFPNIQFFITTHSPQVIASVNSKDIFVCNNFKFDKINIKTKGTDTNTLLSHVFNSTERPQPYIELIEKFNAMMEEDKEVKYLQKIIDEIKILEAKDQGTDVSQLISDLQLQLEAYKFELEHEMD